LEVRCETCKKNRRMSDAFGMENRKHLPLCRGHRPHLRDYDVEECVHQIRPIILGASNTWFPVSLSTIAIPVSADMVMQLVEEKWAKLRNVTGMEIIAFLRSTGDLGRLSQYSDQKIFEAIQSYKNQEQQNGSTRKKPDLKTPEWKVFIEHDPNLNDGENFEIRFFNPQSSRAFLIASHS
ncbi:hypothetical protein JZU69_05050, partial [bacterium]|nr:hypothetical protein [bacterium]